MFWLQQVHAINCNRLLEVRWNREALPPYATDYTVRMGNQGYKAHTEEALRDSALPVLKGIFLSSLMYELRRWPRFSARIAVGLSNEIPTLLPIYSAARTTPFCSDT